MTISTKCKACGTAYTVPDTMAGKRAKCKKCGGIVTIPEPEQPVMADFGDDDPLGGNLGAWEAAASPSGGAPLGSAGRPVSRAKSSGSEGIPKIVWIAGGIGGGVLVLLLLLMLIFGGGSDDEPVAAGETPATSGGGTPVSASGSGNSTGGTTTGGSSQVAQVNDSAPWRWQAESLPTVPSGLAQQPVRLVASPASVLFSGPGAGQAVVAYTRYGQDQDTLVQRLDLKSGQVINEHSFDLNSKLFGGSRDGATFLLLPGKVFAAQEVLQVWKWADGGPQMVVEWKPYEAQSSKRYNWAIMPTDNLVLTHHSSESAAIAWDATTGREVYRVPAQTSRAMQVSPGGSYLVDQSGVWLRFFKSADGTHVGSLGPLPAEFTSLGAVAFSPDGRQIGATFNAPTGGANTLALFDTATGKPGKAVEIPQAGNHLQWVGNGYLLCGAHLISLAHEMTVWQYLGLTPYPQPLDSRAWFFARGGGENYLAAATVPSGDVVSKIDGFVAANTPILKTGDTVALQVTASDKAPKTTMQSELTETFRGKLAAAGYQVADGQPYTLQVTVTEVDSGRKLEYRSFGSGAGSGTIQVPDRKVHCDVVFVDSDGKEVWKVSSSFGPAYMSMNRGEGDLVTQLLASRWTSLDSWIERLEITKLVRRFSSTGEFGQSTLEPTGERILKVPTL